MVINPPEIHLPRYQYCGSFKKLEKRLKRGNLGMIGVDRAYEKYCTCHSKTKDTKERHITDQELIDNLNAIEELTFQERIDR